MIILGINETSHDASVSLIKDGDILFAGHAERYSKQKNDWYTNIDLINDAIQYGFPDKIAYYENPLLKASRLLLKGGNGNWKPQQNIKVYQLNILNIIIHMHVLDTIQVNLMMQL